MQAYQTRKSSKRNNYNKISTEKREQLVEMIIQRGISVKKASMLLGLKYSTAKHIFHHYKQTGDVRTPLMQRKEIMTSHLAQRYNLAQIRPQEQSQAPLFMNRNPQMLCSPSIDENNLRNLNAFLSNFCNCFETNLPSDGKDSNLTGNKVILPVPLNFWNSSPIGLIPN